MSDMQMWKLGGLIYFLIIIIIIFKCSTKTWQKLLTVGLEDIKTEWKQVEENLKSYKKIFRLDYNC